MMRRIAPAGLAVLAVLWAARAADALDWPTARASAQRTGNLDGRPGPAMPTVLWAHRAQEHYVASPVPGDDVLYVSGLGAFNTGLLHCLSAAPGAPRRVAWTKAAPYVRRPTVCSPAVADGLLVFGDGMHQTDDAILYCVQARDGRPVWQFSLPGQLVHLEASPTIDRGRVYVGGGAAGVLCLDLKRVRLDGADLDLAAAQARLEKHWAELVARYEDERKKDPDFAVPPGDDALPKPSPKLLWQAGKDAWHVDAPVAVVGDRVLVASAYLDEEKVGKRALLALNAADGRVLWETPLKINPWAGATVAGDLVLVGSSSIRFEPKRVQGAAGEVVAVGLADGQVKWRKDVPGGVLAAVAVQGGLAVFTATDGKVRAWTAATGEEKWAYDAGQPFFGGPAIAAGTVYAADLRAHVHALNLADGQVKWSLDVGRAPEVLAPGMVFAAPTVHGGRVYLATCNIEGDAARPSAVICLADRTAVASSSAPPPPVVDRRRRTVALACRIAPRKLPTLKDIYPIEVVCTRPSPEGLKAHETVLVFEGRPSEVHRALESLGLRPGTPARGEAGATTGPRVEVFLEFAGPGGRTRTIPVEQALVDVRTGRRLPPLAWHFTGSVLRQPDPNRPDQVYGADLTGTLIAVYPVTDETVLQSGLTMKEEGLLKLETNKNVLPAEGTAVTLVLAVKDAAGLGPAPAKHFRFSISDFRFGAGGEWPWAVSVQSKIPKSEIENAVLPLPLAVTAPVAAERDALWPMPIALAPPEMAIRDGPRGAPGAPGSPGRPFARPVVDLPPVAPDPLPVPPPPVLVPSGGPAKAVLPEPPGLPLVLSATRPVGDRPSLEADPVGAAWQGAPLTPPGMRQGLAPLVPVTVPDPFAMRRALGLREVPPDTDPPVPVRGVPGKVSLPPAPHETFSILDF